MLTRFLLLFTLVLAPLAHAQTPTVTPNAQMAGWYGRGFYDDLVNRADELIGDNPNPDPQLLVWRGLAFFQLGWFAESKDDLTRAQKAGVDAEAIAETLQKIDKLQQLQPRFTREIKNGDQVVFRVHYASNDAVTNGIMARLPQAYRISETMFGSDVLATTVYIFDSYAYFRAFYQARMGKAPGSWYGAVTINNVIYMSLQNPDGSAAVADVEHLKSTIAHEFNHAMLRRLIGTVKMPQWFVEGLAQVAGAQVGANDVALNDYEIKRLFAVNALVPPSKLEASDSFGSHTEIGAGLDRQGAGIIAPSPYAQGFHMTRFLLANMKRGQLGDFLNLARQDNDFNQAFSEEFNASLQDFYQSWYQDTARRVR